MEISHENSPLSYAHLDRNLLDTYWSRKSLRAEVVEKTHTVYA
jgi:hypothetical protein